MKKLFLFATATIMLCNVDTSAQTLDVEALHDICPSTAREVYGVSRYVKLDGAQQRALAVALAKEDSCMIAMIRDDGGVLTVRNSRRMEKMHARTLADILSKEQLEQYYRGVFDKEADAEGTSIANKLQKKYDLTDQNWKFIRVAFYKIALESRVINRIMADKPALAKKMIEKLRTEQIAAIEAKGGIRVNPEGNKVTVVKQFDPNRLHRE